MVFTETKLAGVFIIDVERRDDARGFFAGAFCEAQFAPRGLNTRIAQVNISFNHTKGTIRGMRFRYPPAAETKLVRCSRGAVLDVVVDLRPESRTYLDRVAVELSAQNQRAIYIPARFAHGYQTLKDATEITYCVSECHAPEEEGGLPFNDPALGLEWPLPVSAISAKDQQWPPLSGLERTLAVRMCLSGEIAR
jgi:dTDP-4-dehydrorhamnose 3,5-epimerase